MPRRLLSILALSVAASSLVACGDSSPTQPSGLRPNADASLSVDPGTCRTGWNSSTGRCNPE